MLALAEIAAAAWGEDPSNTEVLLLGSVRDAVRALDRLCALRLLAALGSELAFALQSDVLFEERLVDAAIGEAYDQLAVLSKDDPSRDHVFAQLRALQSDRALRRVTQNARRFELGHGELDAAIEHARAVLAGPT